jgi:uncharacterized protein YbbC (DUF1343 family)
MTAGEIAMMACARGWVSRVPRLDVVKMQGWQRGMTWQDTGLRWHPTSPNIPHSISPFYYVTTGILGGATAVDIGIGTEEPFGYAGGSGIHPNALLAYCQRLNTPSRLTRKTASAACASTFIPATPPTSPRSMCCYSPRSTASPAAKSSAA